MPRLENLVRTVRDRAAALRRNIPLVGYIGWAGNGNLGDDAMLAVARGMLSPSILIPYGGPRRERILARFGLSGPRYFHSVALGGGTLISSSLFPSVVKTALDQRLRVWSLGTGAGSSGFEMAPEISLEEWRDLLPGIRPLGVRGPRSQATLYALGITHGEVIGDLALGLMRDVVMGPTKRFAINVALASGRGYDGAGELRALETPLARLICDGWQPVPLAMTESDIKPLTALLSRISADAVPMHRPTSPDEFFQLVSPCTFTVAVRLHAAVLSCCAGVPPLVLGYRDKCADFMESMELSEWNIPWESVTESHVSDRLLGLVAIAPSLRYSILKSGVEWKRRQQEYAVSATRDLHEP